MASYTPLGPKKQAQVPVWLVRSIRGSMGPIRANLSYLVKMAVLAPSVGHHGRPVGFTQGPHLKFSIRLDPIDHKNTLRWPFWGAQILLSSSRRWDPQDAAGEDRLCGVAGDTWAEADLASEVHAVEHVLHGRARLKCETKFGRGRSGWWVGV